MTDALNERAARVQRRRPHEGIQVRHARRCGTKTGMACSCTPSYQAQVWSPRDRKPIRKTFAVLAEARAWRQESQVALRKGTLRVGSRLTLQEAAEEWLAAAETGVIRTRSGDAYKPSALRSYRQVRNATVVPALVQQRLSAITSTMLQDIANQQAAAERGTLQGHQRTTSVKNFSENDSTQPSTRDWGGTNRDERRVAPKEFMPPKSRR